MRYMIHASPPRMWYVTEYLVPSMVEQGIPPDDIEIWNDTNGIGNLKSCLESFRACGKRSGGTWHLQDDVIICRDFAERTRQYEGEEIVCGYACKNFECLTQKGRVPGIFMWYSFPCTFIPNWIAGDFVRWYHCYGKTMPQRQQLRLQGKGDDAFFKDYIRLEREYDWVINLYPPLVDHIDYLIGGTLVNHLRVYKVNRAAGFKDTDLVDRLAEQLKKR